jgi:hypothetical protein
MLDSTSGGQASMLGGSGENKWFWGFLVLIVGFWG